MKASLQFLCFLFIAFDTIIYTSPVPAVPLNHDTKTFGEDPYQFVKNITRIPVKGAKLQLEEDGDEDSTLSSAQFNFIGNNVAKVVASSLTGNVGGIFSGGLNLLNTNNRVNSLLGRFGVKRPVAEAPNGTVTTSNTVTASAVPTDEEDDDEDSVARIDI